MYHLTCLFFIRIFNSNLLANVTYTVQYCQLQSPCWASLVAQLVKNLPAMWETWVWSLGWEDPLEKGKAPVLSTPVYWPGEFHGLYSPWGCKESDMTEQLSHFHTCYTLDPQNLFILWLSFESLTKLSLFLPSPSPWQILFYSKFLWIWLFSLDPSYKYST